MNSKILDWKSNPDFLQEPELKNADADLTAYVSKINEDDYNIKFYIEEEQNNVKYQNTLKVNVENIAKNKIKIWEQYMKVCMLHFWRNFFPSKTSFRLL